MIIKNKQKKKLDEELQTVKQNDSFSVATIFIIYYY
jgi:hypothetical protein